MTEVISVYDDGVRLDIPFEACVLYHGRDSIGGLSLGYRLLRFALNKLTDGRIPERKEITFKTAFPGPGLRDAVEMTTRAVTRKAYEVLENAPEGTPEGVYGHMYFEITVGSRTLCCALKLGVLPEEFVQTGRAIKKGNYSEQDARHWREQKDALSEAIWNIPNFEDVLSFSMKE